MNRTLVMNNDINEIVNKTKRQNETVIVINEYTNCFAKFNVEIILQFFTIFSKVRAD